MEYGKEKKIEGKEDKKEKPGKLKLSPDVSFPFSSVSPDTSMTWMRTSASRRSFRNLFPLPRPSQAPGTKPATSFNRTGTYRQPLASCPYIAWHLSVRDEHGQGIE